MVHDKMVNATLIILLIVGIIILIAATVLSAMTANDIKKKKYPNAHKYATYTAVASGVGIAMMLVALFVYIYVARHDIAKTTARVAGLYAGGM